jgi:hypothetical protein
MVIRGFRPALTSVDRSLLSPEIAGDTHNVRLEDGSVRVRNGIREVAASFSGTPKGLHFAIGYDNSYVKKEEYVGFRLSGGSVKPFSIHVDTGVGTEITNGGTPLALTSAEWIGENFNGKALYLRPGGAVYRHEIGNNTSWSLLDPGQPNQFLTGNYPRLTFEKTESGDTSTTGTTFSWAGFTGGGFADNGGSGVCPTSFGSVSGSSVVVDANNGGILYTWYDFDLDMNAATAGIQDWSNATGIQFTLERDDFERWQQGGTNDWPWAIGSGNARIWLTDNAANTVELTGAVQTIVSESGRYSYRFILEIPVASRGAQWSDSRYLQIRLPANWDNGVASSAAQRDTDFSVSQITVQAVGASITTPDTVGIRFGAVAYNEEYDVEAVTPTFSEQVNISIEDASRYFAPTATATFLGNVVTLTIPEAQVTTLQAAAGVSHIRYYVAFMDEGTATSYTMRLMGVQDVDAVGAGTYEIPYTYEELRELTLREEGIGTYTAVGTPVCMAAYRQWMVWGYAGGIANVKHSRVGVPFALASTSDDAGGGDLPEDQNRAATFTLSDNFADQPVSMVGTDSSLYILGGQGVYVQTGPKPYQLTPPRRVPGALGTLGLRSACQWRSENGIEGVAYVSKDAESVWFVVAQASFDTGEPSHALQELTAGVRGKLKTFLFASTAPTVDKVYIFHDQRDDALWVCYENRAMVLRRKNIFNKGRAWEFYTYNITTGTLTDWAARQEHGLRCLKSTGSLYEAERRKSTNFALIAGTGRDDGGNVPADRYWESGEFLGTRRRAFRARVERQTDSEAVTVTAYTDREPSGQSITIAANDKYKRFGQFAMGQSHRYRLTVTEAQAGVQLLEIEERAVGKGYNQ